MATKEQLETRIAELEEAIASGELAVKHQGRFVRYRSLPEMRDILSGLKNELQKFSGGRRRHHTSLINTAYDRGL